MEDKSKLIYADYKASIHMHGLLAHLARKYGLSRQRISAIIKSMEPEDSRELAGVKFWDSVLKGEPDECWPYMSKSGEPASGHARQAWVFANGEIPEGQVVCHKCDYPPCCNLGHLFLGTLSDNQKDRAAKGRYRIYDRKQNPNREKFAGYSKRASILTDNAIDDLVTLMGLMPGVPQQEIIERALVEYWEYLKKQAEYTAPVVPADTRPWIGVDTPPDHSHNVEIILDGRTPALGWFGTTTRAWRIDIPSENEYRYPADTGQTVTAWRELAPDGEGE